MKFKVILVTTFISVTPAWAAESSSVESTISNNFHLLTHHCEVEASDGPESTPQSPPLNVDDTTTPGCNKWEINFVADADITNQARGWELPLVDLNYGIGDNLELSYEVPYLNVSTASSSSSAMGQSKVGIKDMFYENEKSQIQFAVYPQFSFLSANSAAAKKGLSEAGTYASLPLLMAVRIGETRLGGIDLTANVSYNGMINKAPEPFIAAGVGVGLPIHRRIAIMGEISTEQSLSKSTDEPRDQIIKTDFGVVATISKDILAFASVGHSLYASDAFNHTYVLTGMRIVFGGVLPTTHEDKLASIW